jgi:hypothetical protein
MVFNGDFINGKLDVVHAFPPTGKTFDGFASCIIETRESVDMTFPL